MWMLVEHLTNTGVVHGEAIALAQLTWAKTDPGRLDHATKTFVENMEKPDGSGRWPSCGADDSQANCFARLVPVTILYAGSAQREAKVEEAIRVTQNNPTAVKFGLCGSGILNSVLLGKTIGEALADAKANADDELRDAFTRAETVARGQNLSDFLGELSKEMMKGQEDSPSYTLKARSCALPGSFIAPVRLLSAVDGPPGDLAFQEAVRANILAAGDTCSRALLLGAIMAAAAGSVPHSWVAKCKFAAKVEAAAQDLLVARRKLASPPANAVASAL
jgi:ADP-ribosylglycohydrolase